MSCIDLRVRLLIVIWLVLRAVLSMFAVLVLSALCVDSAVTCVLLSMSVLLCNLI